QVKLGGGRPLRHQKPPGAREPPNPIGNRGVGDKQLFATKLSASRRHLYIVEIPTCRALEDGDRRARFATANWCKVFLLLFDSGYCIDDGTAQYHRGKERS